MQSLIINIVGMLLSIFFILSLSLFTYLLDVPVTHFYLSFIYLSWVSHQARALSPFANGKHQTFWPILHPLCLSHCRNDDQCKRLTRDLTMRPMASVRTVGKPRLEPVQPPTHDTLPVSCGWESIRTCSPCLHWRISTVNKSQVRQCGASSWQLIRKHHLSAGLCNNLFISRANLTPNRLGKSVAVILDFTCCRRHATFK